MAEFKNVVEFNDFALVLDTIIALPKKPTQAEIEAVLAENDIIFPSVSVKFFMYSVTNGRMFQVNYVGELFKYFYIKLKEAV